MTVLAVLADAWASLRPSRTDWGDQRERHPDVADDIRQDWDFDDFLLHASLLPVLQAFAPAQCAVIVAGAGLPASPPFQNLGLDDIEPNAELTDLPLHLELTATHILDDGQVFPRQLRHHHFRPAERGKGLMGLPGLIEWTWKAGNWARCSRTVGGDSGREYLIPTAVRIRRG